MYRNPCRRGRHDVVYGFCDIRRDIARGRRLGMLFKTARLATILYYDNAQCVILIIAPVKWLNTLSTEPITTVFPTLSSPWSVVYNLTYFARGKAPSPYFHRRLPAVRQRYRSRHDRITVFSLTSSHVLYLPPQLFIARPYAIDLNVCHIIISKHVATRVLPSFSHPRIALTFFCFQIKTHNNSDGPLPRIYN